MHHCVMAFLLIVISSCGNLKNYDKEKKISSHEEKICGKDLCSVLTRTNDSFHVVVKKKKDQNQLTPKQIKLSVECYKSSDVNDFPVHLKKIERSTKLLEVKKHDASWTVDSKQVKERCGLRLHLEEGKKKESHIYTTLPSVE